MLPALAGVGEPADHVDAVGNRLVRGGDKGAMGHGPAGKRPADFVRRLDLRQRQRVCHHRRLAFEGGAGNRRRQPLGLHALHGDVDVADRVESLQPRQNVGIGGAVAQVGRQRQHVAQCGRTARALLAHHLDEGAVARGHLKAVDLFGAAHVEAGIDVGAVVDAKGIEQPADGVQRHVLIADVQINGPAVGLALRGQPDRLCGQVFEAAHRRQTIGMAGAVVALLEQPQQRDIALFADTQRVAVPVKGALDHRLKADPADRRVHVGEEFGQLAGIGIEEVGLEELAADVGLGGTQTDLAHGLHQRLFAGLDELADRRVLLLR